jgi:hypothetical protein
MKTFKQTIREEQHKLMLVVDYKYSYGFDRTATILLDMIKEKYQDKAKGQRYSNESYVQYRWVGGSRYDLIDIERCAKLIKDVDVYYE